MKTFWVAILFMVNSVALAALPARVNGDELPSLAPMVEQVVPAVVNISTRSHASIAQNPLFNDPFFRRFFNVPERPQQQVRPQSLGSGVVIDADNGYVITNHHVIGRADEITVTLRDGRELSAKLLGSDPEADVAVLQVKADNLSAIKLSDSDRLRVGDFVVAIGNPFGLGQTVTSGIVSAMGRSGLGIEGYEDFIQTDASINPGNSGGALVNLKGELVGMNTAILSPGAGGGNVGIGFAIPVNMVSQIVDQLVEHGEVSRGVLGVVTQDLTADLAQAFGIKARKGAVISRVIPDSPAEAAGIKAGDVVIEVNGRDIDNSMDMRNAVGMVRIGQKLDIRLIRDNREMSLKASIEKPTRQDMAGEKISPKLAGATIGQVQDKDDGSLYHVVVLDVKQGTPAWYARLQKGDEILSVNRQPVKKLEDVARYAKGSGQLLLNIQRGSVALFILLK
ncbi:MAG: DegQ family serine endoprotease [Gammaproteobacteria bacterium]|nr:DegQ family serine endoprotease [Gammaproteobacteria bacterium]MDH5736470.1 DegQ family serine endoprotease [Gammaproteobacteria bacterium]